MNRQDGQATVETVALIPLLVLVAAAAFHVLAAGAAAEAAASAAQAGAVAALQERDPVAAARHAARGWPATSVHVRRGRVRVTVRPRVPVAWLARRLQATAVADAGRWAHRAPSAAAVRGGDGAGARP